MRPPATLGLLAGLGHGGALLLPGIGIEGRVLPLLSAGLLAAGLVLAARALLLAADGPEAARAGFLAGGSFSLVSLHWIPAAAEPWWGVAGGLLGGLTVWSVHGAVAGLVFAGMARLRDRWPLVALFPLGWLVLEWLPGALPVLLLPRPDLAAVLLDLPGALALAPLAGGAVVVALWAGPAALVAGWRIDRASGVVRGRRAGGWAVLFAIPLLWGVLGGPRDAGPRPVPVALDRGPPEPTAPASGSLPVVLAELPLDRGVLTDSAARRAALLEGVGKGPADLWPESLLSDLGDVPGGEGIAAPSRSPVAGMLGGTGGPRHNMLVVRDPEGPDAVVHRKRWLVPGIERTRLVGAGLEGRGLAPGPPPRAFEWRERRVGALICFEAFFPSAVAGLRRDGATLLLHTGNDAMLQPGGPLPVIGDAARRQQEAILRLRAREYALPIVRSTVGGRAGGWSAEGRRLPEERTEGRVRVEAPAAGPPPLAAAAAPVAPPVAAGLLLVGLLLAAFGTGARPFPARDPQAGRQGSGDRVTGREHAHRSPIRGTARGRRGL